jgi:hypothetical protein
MSVSETFQLRARPATRTHSGLLPLVVVLALGLALLVVLLAVGTGDSTAHHIAGAKVTPHLAR